MNKELLKKLLNNIIDDLMDHYGNDGCNDIFSDDPLLKRVTKEERKELDAYWVEKFPDFAKELGSEEMVFNTSILEVAKVKLNEIL